MKDEAYLQFPLPLVSFSEDKSAVLNYCVAYGLFRYAETLADDDPEMHELPKEMPHNYRASDWPIVAAARKVGIKVGSITHERQLFQTANAFMTDLTSRCGNPPLVRLRHDLPFDIRDNPHWKLIDFQILCAVYSSIGSKPYSRINWERVAMLSTGAKNQDTLNYLKRPLPTRKQVRRVLDKLQALGFFSRVVLNKRITFVSNRLKEADLIRAAQKTATPSKGATLIGTRQKRAT